MDSIQFPLGTTQRIVILNLSVSVNAFQKFKIVFKNSRTTGVHDDGRGRTWATIRDEAPCMLFMYDIEYVYIVGVGGDDINRVVVSKAAPPMVSAIIMAEI
jgi:hypothetical protein